MFVLVEITIQCVFIALKPPEIRRMCLPSLILHVLVLWYSLSSCIERPVINHTDSNRPATSSSKSNSLSIGCRSETKAEAACWFPSPSIYLSEQRLLTTWTTRGLVSSQAERIISAPCCVCIYVGEREAQKEKRPTTWAESWGSVLGCVTETFVCIMWCTLAPRDAFQKEFLA